MAILFHCEHCGKKIEAADNAAGKWGKCPSCHNKLYVPNLNNDEDLKLSPVDETEERRKKELMAETFKLTQDILQEKDIPNGPPVHSETAPKTNEKELTKNIILYLRQMADGNLDDAQRTAYSIVPYGRQAISILDRIALSEMPEPELADIPSHILSGLIRNLRTRMS